MARRGNNIYHRKDGLWEARYVKSIDLYGKKKYGSVYARTYTAAKEKREEIVSTLLLRPQVTSNRTMAIIELAQEWLFINQNRLKPATVQKYRNFIKKHIEGQIGICRAAYMSPLILTDYSNQKLAQGLSPKTVNGILNFLYACMGYGNKQYGFPLFKPVHIKQPRKEMRVLSTSEQKALTQYLLTDLDIYKLGILLSLYTGIRIGELCALQWKDVADGCITIKKTMQRLCKSQGGGTEIVVDEPKSSCSHRIIPLPDFLVPMLEQFRRPNPEAYFLSSLGRPIVEPRVMQYRFKKYIKDIAIPPANLHALRHTFATHCVACGFDIKTLSEILGHSSTAMTMERYVHSSFDSRIKNMSKLKLIS